MAIADACKALPASEVGARFNVSGVEVREDTVFGSGHECVYGANVVDLVPLFSLFIIIELDAQHAPEVPSWHAERCRDPVYNQHDIVLGDDPACGQDGTRYAIKHGVWFISAFVVDLEGTDQSEPFRELLVDYLPRLPLDRA